MSARPAGEGDRGGCPPRPLPEPTSLTGESGHTGVEGDSATRCKRRPSRDHPAQPAPTPAAPGSEQAAWGQQARASEAVGRVGDPVGGLLLGALGGAVGGEEGLVSF